jgi:hypothetical protein
MTEVSKVVVTSGPRAPRNRSVLKTQDDKKEVQVVVIGWLRQAAIRTARTYLQSVLGNLANVGIAGTVAVTAFANLSAEEQAAIHRAYSALEFWQVLLIALSTAVAPAVLAFLQNTVELLTKLDNPETRA